MKRTKQLWFLLIFCCMITGISVNAEEKTVTVEMTEADRYNPKYNMPILPQTGEEKLDKAGLSATDLQELETVLVNAWQNYQTSVDVSKYNLTVADGAYATYYWQILNQHPEMFYVEGGVGCLCVGNDVMNLTISYSMKQEEIKTVQQQMDAAVNEVLVLISQDMEEYEKALVVHDWLVNYCRYDYENCEANTIPASSYSAYGALAYGVAVCDGYSKAYQYILDYKLGIDCYRITSNTMNHAWNLIELDGKYYHVDTTWDDPVRDKIGQVLHDNFLLSDSGITSTGHSGWDTTVSATDTTYESNPNWKNTSGQAVYYNGIWYYADDESKSIVSTTDILNGTTKCVYSLGTWKAGASSYWKGAFSYPQVYKNKLLFNGPKKIYSMTFSNEQVKEIYAPDMQADTTSTVYNIYGFDIKDGKLRYLISSDANHTGKETIYEMDYPALGTIAGTATISGKAIYGEMLTANVTLSTGIEGTLFFQWYRQGIAISGATDATYTLTKADIGKIISVKATVEDYLGELVTLTDEVQKPAASVPSDPVVLVAKRGQTLSAISLPGGYSWENPDIVMTETGIKTYGIIYCPDSEIYHPVTGLTATVTITCESHEWNEGEVIKAPTVLENGIREYRCKYCEETKEEDIPKLQDTENTGDTGTGTENNVGDKETPVVLKKGMTFTDSKTGNKYKITKVTKTKTEASFTGNTNKKKKSITIPASVKYGEKTITVTAVAKNAMKNNKIITSVTVGKNVTSIGASAFQGCKKLKTINLKSTKIKTFGSNCIKNVYKKVTIKCPKKCKSKYKKKLTKKTGFTKQMKVK